MGETVTRVRPGSTTDGHGNTVPDWSEGAVAALDIDDCAFAPVQTPEDRTGGRQGVVDAGTVYAPHGADVVATDRLVVRGETYEIDAKPGDWVSPFTGAGAGVEISIRRVAG